MPRNLKMSRNTVKKILNSYFALRMCMNLLVTKSIRSNQAYRTALIWWLLLVAFACVSRSLYDRSSVPVCQRLHGTDTLGLERVFHGSPRRRSASSYSLSRVLIFAVSISASCDQIRRHCPAHLPSPSSHSQPIPLIRACGITIAICVVSAMA